VHGILCTGKHAHVTRTACHGWVAQCAMRIASSNPNPPCDQPLNTSSPTSLSRPFPMEDAGAAGPQGLPSFVHI
jgi:hypothetical protein